MQAAIPRERVQVADGRDPLGERGSVKRGRNGAVVGPVVASRFGAQLIVDAASRDGLFGGIAARQVPP